MFLRYFVLAAILVTANHVRAQSSSSLDSLRKEITSLRQDVSEIELNLATSENKFKRGIFVATLGYSIVITGGLMLGRKRDELGKGLLVAGGATGVIGTVLLVDSFKYMGRSSKRKKFVKR